jgi:CRP-like cAMP-binding protein
MSTPLHALLEAPDFPEGTAWQRRRFAANEVIVREGEQAKDVYVILEGSVRVTGTVEVDPERRMHPGFCDLSAGQVFGELCLFDRAPRSATVAAVSDCEIAVVDGETLLRFIDTHPERGYFVLRHIIQTLVDRLREANRRFVSVFTWGLKAHRIDRHL